MPDRTKILFALAIMGGLASPARADEDIIVNGLPCNALCRQWMGIKLPSEPQPESRAPAEKRAQERASRPEARKAAVARHAVKPAKIARSSAPLGKPDALAKSTSAHAAKVVAPETPAPEATSPAVVQAPPAAPQPSAPLASSAPPTPAPEAAPPAVVQGPTATPEASAPSASSAPSTPAEASPPAVVQAPPATPEASAPSASSAPPTPAPEASPPAVAQAPAAAPEASTPVASSSPSPTPVAPSEAAAAPTSSGAPQIASLDRSGPTETRRQIAIVMTKLDVKDIADLHDKSIVLAGAMNVSDARLKAAFATAGADGAAFKQGDVKDADEVESGAVAAAILAVVTPEVAGAFPEIPGYRLLRVEVAPDASR